MSIGTTSAMGSGDLSRSVGMELPFLRRYARALTGSQGAGDCYAAATLEAILADRHIYDTEISARAALFRAFHQIWSRAGAVFVKQVVRRFHAASLISGALISFSGLSQTGPAGRQFRVLPDQRFGFCARVFA